IPSARSTPPSAGASATSISGRTAPACSTASPWRRPATSASTFPSPRLTRESPVFKNEEMEINLGPQHPSTHGVLRVKLRLDGETVKHCEPIVGYLHRGVEKICEDKTFFQGQVWTDRMDYVA